VCTVSWIQEPAGYHLLSNRDEKLTRPSGFGPEIREKNGVRFVSPLDGAQLGTWIAVNEMGLGLAILNGEVSNGGGLAERRSRGLLILDLIDATDVQEIRNRLALADLSIYASFHILALDYFQGSMVADWNAPTLGFRGDTAAACPLTSSSFDASGAAVTRRSEFERLRKTRGPLNAGVLLDFHESHVPQAGPYSPCMHRSDAATVSFSWVNVCNREVSLYYSPAPPCQWVLGETLAIARRERATWASSF
jgi:uncharacterized protein with NRDE domain